jgi:hypothetical protein
MRGGLGCRFYHSAREVYDASRSDGRREGPAQPRRQHEISYDAQSEQFESQDGESDGEQYVDNEGVDRTSDDESASPDADEYEEDEQVSESKEEAAKISNESNEDKELSNEQNTSIDSDGDGSLVSNDDGYWVEDDQDAEEQPSVLPDPHRSRRWRPQCRYGNECHALQQGIGCEFHHTAKEMFNASRKDRRLEPHSEQWKPTAVSGKVTLSALIDELAAAGTDFTKFENDLGWKVEELLQKMRAATPAERTAAGGYHIVRGIMQVTGQTGVTQNIVVLIDGCAALSMASTDVPITITGKSNARFRGATSPELVHGKHVGNITVHTTEGLLNLVEVHQVEAMQSGQVIVSVFQLLTTFGDMFGLSVKRGNMAMFIPTNSVSAVQRTRYDLVWHAGLMKMANVERVTATGGSDGQVGVFTTGGHNSETGGNVHAVHAVSSTPIRETAAPATETMPDSVNNKGYERWFAVGSATQLNDEANMIRDALAASLLDTGLSEADIELEPIPSPPPTSAHAIEDSNVHVGSVQHSVPAQGRDDEGLIAMVLSNTGTHAIQAPASSVDPDLAIEVTNEVVADAPMLMLRTGAHTEASMPTERQMCDMHTVCDVQDANHLNDANEEDNDEARAPDVCGNQPEHGVLMESDQAGARTMRLWDEKDLNIAGTIESIVPEPASFIASGYGGVHTFHADHRLDDDCDDYDVDRCRESGHRGEQSFKAQRGNLPPGVASNNRVIKDGRMRIVSNVGRQDDSNKRRLDDCDRAHGRAVVRRVDYNPEVRPPDVAIDDGCATVQVCNMPEGRVEEDTAADVHATEEMPTGKVELTRRLLARAELREPIVQLYAASMADVGPTCEESGLSDCIATMTPVTSVKQSNATVPTASAVPSTAVIAASSHGTLGVDVMHRHEMIEPMECDKKNDDNKETAVANLDNIFWNHDWIVEINNALDDRSNRKHNRSYEGDHVVVAPECQCIASPPLCDSAAQGAVLRSK